MDARIGVITLGVAAAGQDRSWGGYSGYFADLDGHAWEVAFNPSLSIGADGLPARARLAKAITETLTDEGFGAATTT